MPTELTNGGVKFGDGTTQTTAAVTPTTTPGWNVVYTVTNVGNGGTYTLPANCLGVYVWARIYGGNNNGGVYAVQIRNAAGSELGSLYVHGTNDGPNRNDGGSGMYMSGAAFIPVPTNARSIYAYTTSNNVGGDFYVGAYVTR